MKYFFRILSMGLLFLSLVQCGKGDDNNNPDEDCGAAANWSDDFIDNFNTESSSADQSLRLLYYENVSTPENICAQGSTSASFLVDFNDSGKPAAILDISGKAYWGIADKKYAVLKVTDNLFPNRYYAESGPLNLEPFFDVLPGWIGLTLIFTVQSQGSLAADQALIQSSVEATNIRFMYSEYQ